MNDYRFCRNRLRGGESRCNGGASDGCACGSYSLADEEEQVKLAKKNLRIAELRLERKNLWQRAEELRRELANVESRLYDLGLADNN